MQGIDCDGRTLNTDQTWQHLRPGEKKTCGGCHVHSKPSRIAFQNSYAATNTYVIPQLGEGRVPLLTGKVGDVIGTRNAVPTGEADGFPTYGLQIVYDRDIQPIFNARLCFLSQWCICGCRSCVKQSHYSSSLQYKL